MTWAQVARKDFEDAVRAKMLWGLIGVFVGFMAFVVVITLSTTDSFDATGTDALSLTAQLGVLFVPLIALIAGYMAVVGERRSGSLRMLLGYPHSRRDVVLGKLVGRSAVIAVALGVGSAVSALLIAVLIESPAMSDVAGLLGAIVLFGASFTGLAVGISAGVKTRGRAMALAIGSLLVFLVVWNGVAAGVYTAVTGARPGLVAEPWYFLLKRLSPLGAFRALAESVIDVRVYPIFRLGVEDIPRDATGQQLLLSNRVEGSLPFYLKNWFASLTLALWGLVPAVVGYWRFERSDL